LPALLFEGAANAASDELPVGNILQPTAKTIPNGSDARAPERIVTAPENGAHMPNLMLQD
jgi:hypothetical protein